MSFLPSPVFGVTSRTQRHVLGIIEALRDIACDATDSLMSSVSNLASPGLDSRERHRRTAEALQTVIASPSSSYLRSVCLFVLTSSSVGVSELGRLHGRNYVNIIVRQHGPSSRLSAAKVIFHCHGYMWTWSSELIQGCRVTAGDARLSTNLCALVDLGSTAIIAPFFSSAFYVSS